MDPGLQLCSAEAAVYSHFLEAIRARLRAAAYNGRAGLDATALLRQCHRLCKLRGVRAKEGGLGAAEFAQLVRWSTPGVRALGQAEPRKYRQLQLRLFRHLCVSIVAHHSFLLLLSLSKQT
jgi:hypothetical protein